MQLSLSPKLRQTLHFSENAMEIAVSRSAISPRFDADLDRWDSAQREISACRRGCQGSAGTCSQPVISGTAARAPWHRHRLLRDKHTKKCDKIKSAACTFVILSGPAADQGVMASQSFIPTAQRRHTRTCKLPVRLSGIGWVCFALDSSPGEVPLFLAEERLFLRLAPCYCRQLMQDFFMRVSYCG
jgi:hypothetical protein